MDEFLLTEFNPALKGSYFEHVHAELIKRFPIGRIRVLGKQPYNCNSWHHDPEYFMDTRGYHSAMNGGEDQRVHIVTAPPWKAD